MTNIPQNHQNYQNAPKTTKCQKKKPWNLLIDQNNPKISKITKISSIFSLFFVNIYCSPLIVCCCCFWCRSWWLVAFHMKLIGRILLKEKKKNTLSIINLGKENRLSIMNIYYVGCTVHMQSRPHFNITHIN